MTWHQLADLTGVGNEICHHYPTCLAKAVQVIRDRNQRSADDGDLEVRKKYCKRDTAIELVTRVRVHILNIPYQQYRKPPTRYVI